MQFATMLRQACAALKLFGKTPDDLKLMTKGFLWVLEDYSIAQIVEAFKIYFKTHNDLPAPADLVQIIEPQKAPMSQSVYIELIRKRKQDLYLTPDQREYIYEFERREVRKAMEAQQEVKRSMAALLDSYDEYGHAGE